MDTLTKMLGIGLQMEPENDDQARTMEDTRNIFKDIFKEWLKTVRLPDYRGTTDDGYELSRTDSIRRLLITLIDEP